MRSLDRKLLRDLWRLRGQALAISLVIASGVATFVMFLSTLRSLEGARREFYRAQRFGEAFAELARAPESLAERIADIPGVARVETRVSSPVTIRLAGVDDLITGRLLSLNEAPARLDDVRILAGREPDPSRDDEVLLSEGFASARGLGPGDALPVIIRGREETLRVVGLATSPDQVFQVAPGTLIPDFKSYAIAWMARRPLAVAAELEGAFNGLSLRLTSAARPEDVLDAVDGLLDPYGGQPAHLRADQFSHRFLSEEMQQLEGMAGFVPFIFLGVAAFLLNIVVSRLVATQREQIAILKAFGYTNLAIAWHYARLIGLITLLGAGLGVGFGALLGRGMVGMYALYYKIPDMHHELPASIALGAVGVSLAAAWLGAFGALRKAAALPPAEAMRPEPPARYRPALLERLGLGGLLSPAGRMVTRGLERRPVQAVMTTFAIGAAGALIMVGAFFNDAMDELLAIQYGLVQREDLTVQLVEPRSRAALYELESLPGVLSSEPLRTVPVVLRHRQRERRSALQGVPPQPTLHRLLDAELRPFSPPEEGLLLGEGLAKRLGVGPGDVLQVELLTGSQRRLELPVAALVREFIGASCYMSLAALNRALDEGEVIDGAHLRVDSAALAEVVEALQRRPGVAGVTRIDASYEALQEVLTRQMLIFATFNTLLASSIAFGVVTNAARIALSERSRELASLRVLGWTRWEISSILLGELAILTLGAIPLGWAMGVGICVVMIETWQNELLRIPFVLEPRSFAFSASVILVSALISALIVRRKLDRLDLIAVLKTRE